MKILRRRPRQGENSLRTYVADTGSAATTYTDTNATEPGERYVYRVKALRGGEKSGRSNYARVDLPESEPEPASTPEPTPAPTPEPTPEPTPQPAAVEPPPAPQNLLGAANSDGSVTLSWDDPDDDSITGYRILRRDTINQPPGTFSTVAGNTGTASTTYTDNTVSAETRYAYRVKAINSSGASAQSNYINVETTAVPESTSVTVAPTEEPEDEDDPPAYAQQLDSEVEVTVSFGAATYSAEEGGTVDITVALSVDPERQVAIPITKTNRDGASDSDYSGVPESVAFESGETSKTFTVYAVDDTRDDDGESVDLGFGTLPELVNEGATTTTMVSITDNDIPQVIVSFGAMMYSAAEGGAVDITVTLSADPERRVIIPINRRNQGGASVSDYTGVPENVTFESGETSKTFTFTAVDDTDDDDGESVMLSFLTAGLRRVDKITRRTPTVSITDNDVPVVTASFGVATYSASEGGTVDITVTLSANPERQIIIPITKTNGGGASDSDYSGVPENVTFESGETSKTFTFTAVDDTENDEGESVELGFGTLPDRVNGGATASTTITMFTAPVFQSATTSGDGIEVMVTFSEDVEVIPLIEDLGELYEVSVGMFLRAVFNVTVDGKDNLIFSSSYSGRVVTLRLQSPNIRTGQEVKVAYNNIFAREPGGILTDSSGNPVPMFDYQPVTNASRDDDPWEFIDAPVQDKTEMHICAGESGTYGVKLPSQPAGSVALYTRSTPEDVVRSVPEYLTFNQDNWNVYQTITVLTDDTFIDDEGDKLYNRYAWMPEDLLSFWAVSGHRIGGVSLQRTYDNVVRIIVRDSTHPQCSG